MEYCDRLPIPFKDMVLCVISGIDPAFTAEEITDGLDRSNADSDPGKNVLYKVRRSNKRLRGPDTSG